MNETTYHVLLLEDSDMVRHKSSDLLRRSRLGRFLLHEADNLIDGLRILRGMAIDAVLLDLGLPDSEGVGTLKAVRETAPKAAVVVMTADDSDETVMGALAAGAQEYLLKDEVSGPLLQRTIRYAIERNRLEAALRYKANHDVLTGLYSRRYLMDRLEEEVQTSRADKVPLTICLADIDRLKEINDQHGHRRGDDVLERFGKVVSERIPKGDFAGRYGGDEFVIVFPGTTRDAAETLIHRIAADFSLSGRDAQSPEGVIATCSYGLAALSDGCACAAALLKAADEGLYVGKRTPHRR